MDTVITGVFVSNKVPSLLKAIFVELCPRLGLISTTCFIAMRVIAIWGSRLLVLSKNQLGLSWYRSFKHALVGRI